MGTHHFLKSLSLSVFIVLACTAAAQNSMVGDGFGGRLWYRPTNYGVGSYSAFSLCYGDLCDSSNNQLYGWGADNFGEMGNGPGASPSDVPVAIPTMTDVRYFSSGYWSGAVKNDGTGWAWLDPAFPDPTQVISDAKFVDAGFLDISFVKNDGTVWSMGENLSGQLGDGTTVGNMTGLVQMTGVNTAVRVACGFQTTFVLLADSTVLAVGSSRVGLLGDPSVLGEYTVSASPVLGLSGVVDIKANTGGTAALKANGDVYCWGGGSVTGDVDELNDTLPKRVAALHDIVAISSCADGSIFLALDVNKNCYFWGILLGTAQSTPLLVATDVVDIMAGELFAYLVRSDGSLWAVGSSFTGSSIWLDLPNVDTLGNVIIRPQFTQLDPSAVPGSCSVAGVIAVPGSNCDGTITVSNFGGQAPYQYDLGNGPQNSNTFTGLAAGSYTVTITDASGCAVSIPCTVQASPVANVWAIDTVLTEGSSTGLTASGGTNYSWYPPTGLSCTSCYNPTATPTETTEYCVVVSDNNGCGNDTACVRIAVVAPASICTAEHIFIPTAFSPNASGKNDMQCVYGGECITDMVFRIYDRWGNKVFESADTKQCWDGLYKGDALDPGVFVYSFTATLTNSEVVQKKGNITLIR
jgi:gliding motility-associated-like protein